jgi:hypothetical protein
VKSFCSSLGLELVNEEKRREERSITREEKRREVHNKRREEKRREVHNIGRRESGAQALSRHG